MALVMPPGAERISSDWTVFYKHIFLPFWYCLAALMLVLLISVREKSPRVPLIAIVVPIVAMTLGYFLFRKLLTDLTDEVWDNGDELIVVNDGHVEHLPFANVINVSYSGLTNPKRVTLNLRKAGRWGERIVFVPAISLAWFISPTRSSLVDDLIRRADEARQKT